MVKAIKAIVFPGGLNWPLWTAQEQGFLRKYDLEVQIEFYKGTNQLRCISDDFGQRDTGDDSLWPILLSG